MKTLLLVGSLAPALLNFRGPLIADLVAAGWRVVATAPDIDANTAGKLAALGAEARSVGMARTGLSPLADLTYAGALTRLMREERADVLLSYTIKPNIWGAFAAWGAGIPSVAMVTGLGYAFTESGEAHTGAKQRFVAGLARRLYRPATALNSRIIFQNPDDVSDFVAAGCLADTSKVRLVAGSGIDLNHYAPTPLPAEARFLMISRLLKNKGVREYGEAAIRLKEILPDAQFHLVGYLDEGPDGIDEADLVRWIAGGLIYHGHQADVRPFLAASSVYVLPSYREGTPRSVLEAMAANRPIITSDAPGCRETVVNGTNGLLTPVRDVDALTEAMRLLAQDANMRARMGAASLALVRQRFDVQNVNAQIMAVLKEIL